MSENSIGFRAHHFAGMSCTAWWSRTKHLGQKSAYDP